MLVASDDARRWCNTVSCFAKAIATVHTCVAHAPLSIKKFLHYSCVTAVFSDSQTSWKLAMELESMSRRPANPAVHTDDAMSTRQDGLVESQVWNEFKQAIYHALSTARALSCVVSTFWVPVIVVQHGNSSWKFLCQRWKSEVCPSLQTTGTEKSPSLKKT